MEMGEQNRVDVDVVAVLAELREHAIAAIQEQGVAVVLDEVAAASASDVRPSRRFSKHGDPHATLRRDSNPR